MLKAVAGSDRRRPGNAARLGCADLVIATRAANIGLGGCRAPMAAVCASPLSS